MPITLTKSEAARIAGALTTPDAPETTFTGLEFDSRALQGGEIFVALKGERDHGHAFVDQALQKGAALILVEDRSFLSAPFADRVLVVDDTYAALSALGKYWRTSAAVPVAAITGSLGKTAAKEMCAAILGRIGKGTHSKKSFNNHIGVPYTICKISAGERWVVLEMGMNHPGELSALSKIAVPDVAAFTQIAPVHLEFFPSLAAIADAKCEILDGLESTATVVSNADDQELQAALARKKGMRDGPWFSERRFGVSSKCDATFSSITEQGLRGISFHLKLGQTESDIFLPFLGRHNAMNAAAAALTAHALCPDVTADAVREALAEFEPPAMRLNVCRLTADRQLIDDSYNANPLAMKASLALLASQPGKKGAIIGDMLELGEQSKALHAEVGAAASESGLSFLIGVGNAVAAALEEAARGGSNVLHARSPEEAAEAAWERGFDVLLVKGSRGIQLDRSVVRLKELARTN